MMLREESLEDSYVLRDELGRGNFAVVMKCTERRSGDDYAIKIIPKKRKASRRLGSSRQDILRELEAMELARGHPRLLQLHDAVESTKQVGIVTELVRGGELFEYLAEKDAFEESEAVEFMSQLLDGISFLHSRKVVHLDLKPENILLLESSCVSSIKLIDFGLARKLEGEDFTGLLGTAEFVAPEVVNYEPLSTATDMWAIGVIAFIILSGLSPFLGETDQETFQNVSACNFEFFDESFADQKISAEAMNFIDHLLEKNPKKRLTADECLQHPWIIQQSQLRKWGSIRTHALKKFNARRRWNTALNAVRMSMKWKRLTKKKYHTLHPGISLDLSAGFSSDGSSEGEWLSDSAMEDNLLKSKPLGRRRMSSDSAAMRWTSGLIVHKLEACENEEPQAEVDHETEEPKPVNGDSPSATCPLESAPEDREETPEDGSPSHFIGSEEVRKSTSPGFTSLGTDNKQPEPEERQMSPRDGDIRVCVTPPCQPQPKAVNGDTSPLEAASEDGEAMPEDGSPSNCVGSEEVRRSTSPGCNKQPEPEERRISPGCSSPGKGDIKVYVTPPSRPHLTYKGFRDGRNQLVKEKVVSKNLKMWQDREKNASN
eukprot:m.16065 g.16065  ORF g.16065 m.16065 type:complete len:601 (+) comp26726_c0_seq1:124-1926(+)